MRIIEKALPGGGGSASSAHGRWCDRRAMYNAADNHHVGER